MSEKMLFFILHFIGVGLIIIGGFVGVLILAFGVTLVVANAIMMGLYCNIIFK